MRIAAISPSRAFFSKASLMPGCSSVPSHAWARSARILPIPADGRPPGLPDSPGLKRVSFFSVASVIACYLPQDQTTAPLASTHTEGLTLRTYTGLPSVKSMYLRPSQSPFVGRSAVLPDCWAAARIDVARLNHANHGREMRLSSLVRGELSGGGVKVV